MASLVREWVGINTFAPATQTKLLELLGKLKLENVNTLTILVMGKGGVGKSSTVNSIIGERAVSVNPFQSEAPTPFMVSRARAGFTLNVIDTPGLIEGGYINDRALEIIKRFLLNKTIDVLLYVDRLDAYRVDNLDRQVVKAITDSFGKGIWNRALVVLTHAQLSPPDGLPYEDFCSKRSGALLKVVRLGAGLKKLDKQDSAIPVVLVENSGRCKRMKMTRRLVIFLVLLVWSSSCGAYMIHVVPSLQKLRRWVVLCWQVLPDGTAWIPHLVKTITEAVLNGSEADFCERRIEGPNPNDRGKFLIPLLFAFQFFFVVKPIERAIKKDIAKDMEEVE
ncbi:Translocase of chloroplast 34 [Morella rubra]|uniref:Translocase of chloroplast 34 n=1 Tax=Morella rubra TaxID=262757 RepID=A0A6A1W7M9_9ROSI|nr:Translocase of chloroplast 34 [Morella rubra]